MRAYQLQSFDGPTALRLIDVAEPLDDGSRVIVDVCAIGINFPDLLATKGQYQHLPELPFVPGSEIAGTVASSPKGSRWQSGDRVAAFVWDSGYAERAAVPPHAVMPLPADADFATGAAMVVNYHTAHFALTRRGGLREGETLFVMGAAGGIGTAAVQIGKALGARVVGGVATRQQAAIVRRAGAEAVVTLDDGFAADVRAHLGERGVDVVVDPLGDRFFGEALRALAPEGRVLVIGFAGGEIPTLRVNRLLLRNATAVGVGWGAFLEVEPEIALSAAAALAEMFRLGQVRPEIGARYGFEDIPEALLTLERGEIPGKAIVELAGQP